MAARCTQCNIMPTDPKVYGPAAAGASRRCHNLPQHKWTVVVSPRQLHKCPCSRIPDATCYACQAAAASPLLKPQTYPKCSHSFTGNELPDARPHHCPPVCAPAVRRLACALQLQLPALPLAAHNFAECNCAPVTKLACPAAKLVPSVALSIGLAASKTRKKTLKVAANKQHTLSVKATKLNLHTWELLQLCYPTRRKQALQAQLCTHHMPHLTNTEMLTCQAVVLDHS